MHKNKYLQNLIDLKQFTLGKSIGHGGFGSVFEVENIETKKKYAAKIIQCKNDEETRRKAFDREVFIMIYSDNPTIIKLVGFSLKDFDDNYNVTVIMEYITNGSLLKLLDNVRKKKIPEHYNNTIRQIILIGIARGMKYLHDRNIIHRDLKPGNVLLDENLHPIISDFGLSKFVQLENTNEQSICLGTVPYMAPEILLGCDYNRKVDVYAFGILMYEVVTESIHYPDYMNHKMARLVLETSVINNCYRPQFNFKIKSTLKNLIEECWSAELNHRPSFKEIFRKLTSRDYFLDDVDEGEINRYVESITEVNDPFEKLLRENDNLENQIIQATNENSQLKNEIEQLKAAHKKEGIDSSEANDESETNIDQLKDEKTSLLAEIDELNNQKTQMMAEIGKSREEIAQLNAEKQRIISETDQLLKKKDNTTKDDDRKKEYYVSKFNLQDFLFPESAAKIESAKPLISPPKKEKGTLNVLFIGNTNSGKSTAAGHIILNRGLTSHALMTEIQKDVAKYKTKSNEFAFIFDSLDVEREKGISMKLSQKDLQLKINNINIIVAPGSPEFIEEMIKGASRADAFVLFVDAIRDDFDEEISEDSQIYKHALLAYILVRKQLIVAINKMDDITVGYSEERYNEVKNKMTRLLTTIGFPQKSYRFIPISGLKGDNLTKDSPNMFWWRSKSLLEMIGDFNLPEKQIDKPFRFLVHGVHKNSDNETLAFGRVEYGLIRKGQQIVVAPSGILTEVVSIEKNKELVDYAMPLDWVDIILNLSPNDIDSGFVFGNPKKNPPSECTSFTAQLLVTDFSGEIRKGYSAVFNINSAHIKCEFLELVQRIDCHTHKAANNPEFIEKGDAAVVVVKPTKPLSVENYQNYPKLSKFSVFDMGRIVAIGVVISIERK